MTGAIYTMDLPPVTKETRMQKEKVRFLSQTVQLIGLGSKGPWNNSNEEDIPFSPDVNSMGILAKIAQQKWVHTEDNEVGYFRGLIDEAGKKRYVTVKPQMLRIGDIMEAQCSMVFMKTNDGVAKTKLILRAIALANSDHSSKANAERRNMANTPSQSVVKMKRKISFEDEEDDIQTTAKRFNRMEMEEEEEIMMLT
ncbi:uncharacterized protein EV420DRAFT_1649118 [Desarmillaria tabescens]|uniref:Uncharacterized protein n=1 Tax=Armillaria tabescens TaxID=1929756 RepID=A0AA39JKK3_ARMTA|nr:uncharacterized protein EV420DRAFT_1649118 [Desarmillaria tabescens]KAK0443655.1 hypothetical protein EV420DRAFT_1649118 [Desarmillaria tabescens]